MLNKEAFTKLIISPDQWYLPIYALKCMGLDSKKKKKEAHGAWGYVGTRFQPKKGRNYWDLLEDH